jgi:mannitol-specific phosphotransferase system IIBC component
MWVKIKKYFYVFLSGVVSVLVFLFFRRKKIKKDINEQEEIIDYQKGKSENKEKEYENLVEDNNKKIEESKEVKNEENIDNSSDAASFVDDILRKSKSSKSEKD